MNASAAARTFDGIDAIVIGASAGGVEAVMALLRALPPALRAAVIIVLHLPRNHPSSLAEIFGHRCALTVVEAEDKMPIERGTVYVAPPDYHVLVDAGPSLALSVDDPVNYSRPSIDVLFEAAAAHYADRLAAIVLTGANADGAAGMDAVRRTGGITIVQDPDGAFASAMPAAALARGPVDFVLPVPGIVELLRALPTSR